jgi:DNA-binding MarR family transcriptional regulator
MTHKQGQYLAFIECYTKLNKKAPAERDMQNFFQVTAPTVHQMVLTLEKNKFISRTPGMQRSIKIILSSDDIPKLD